MDRRSWPWKKKTSEKVVTTADSASAGSGGNEGNQDNTKTVNYVQISAESYAHLTELEEQVKLLNEKVSSAQSEITTKENLVKQHTKVAEEAISGWEKAEAEAATLKNQLESVTLLKLTAEERAAHLDGALKECMKQIRNVKEESEQKLHDIVFTKTKQWEKVKFELEEKIADFEQELLRASAENGALSRSLQERSNMLMKISEEKSQADAEIEVLKTDIQSCEREINSFKYELHVISKELEIRNEEKNMSIRSAEVANKHHLEDVKKITKLEAECQRLRGLVRKKLPGPAALAQMKLEVENLGRDYGETRLRRSPAKNSSPHLVSAPDFALENIQQVHKENEFLTERLLAMEEETNMLKEALAKRNSELQGSRTMCAKTASKLRSIEEAHMLVLNPKKNPSKPDIDIPFEGSLIQNESNPPSLTSMSEDGIEEEGSCSESWNTVLISDLSHFKKGKDVDQSNKPENSNHLELMDDFLEMERACLSTETNGTIGVSDGVVDKMKIENPDATSLKDGGKKQQPGIDRQTKAVSSNGKHFAGEFAFDRNDVSLSKLQSRISSTFESHTKDTDMGKLIEDIRRIVQDTEEELPQHSVGCTIEEDASCDKRHCPEDLRESKENGSSLMQDSKHCSNTKSSLEEELKHAILQIHDFVLLLGKEAREIQGRTHIDHLLSEKVEEFSASVNKVVCSEISLDDFILALSHILSEASELSFNMLSDKSNEGECNSSDCVDKVTLLENRVDRHEPTKERFSRDCTLVPCSASDPEIFKEGPIGPGFELKVMTQKCSLEELEQVKLEKDNMAMDLARCNETLEQTKVHLFETEQQLAELKSQLADCQKSNSLAETQLKCMAESYKSLESRAQELETEINLLCAKAEALDNELQEERCSHQDDLAKCKDLQEQIERNDKCSKCSFPSDADADVKMKQEREIAAAAEKLAECQETIFLLGRQLKAMRPPAEMVSSPNDRHRMSDEFLEDEPTSGLNPRGMLNSLHPDQVEMENVASSTALRSGGESPLDGYNSHLSPSDTEASSFPRSPSSSKRPKHRPSRSSSSSSSLSNALPEKHGRGFSRFFSKGKGDH